MTVEVSGDLPREYAGDGIDGGDVRIDQLGDGFAVLRHPDVLRQDEFQVLAKVQFEFSSGNLYGINSFLF